MKYRNVTPRLLTAVSVVALALSLAALIALCIAQRIPVADTLVYRVEGAAVANGADPYGFTVTEWPLPATSPPFAAILFVPTTWLPVPALKVVFVAGNAILLALLVRLSCRFAGLPARTPLVISAIAAGLWLEPVFQTLLVGQLNLALVCLVLWDLSRDKEAIGKGFALGVAAGVKPTAAVFIVHLLITGRVRAGLTALASFTGTVLLGALVLPHASAEFWTRRIFRTGRAGHAWTVENQSLQGLFARVLHTSEPGTAWALAVALTAVAGLWTARRAAAEWGVLVTATTALLVSPVSPSHHWVWCVPLLAVLIAEGRTRTAAVVAAVLVVRTLRLVPHRDSLDLQLPWWQQPLASPYPLLGLALLAFAGWRTAPALTLPGPRGEYPRTDDLSTSPEVPAGRPEVHCRP
ncbi:MULTISPECIES: glycosyltransferase 87 family protein [unclassified Streptomyces]|uniref:glycosyltransferase 87 family protein n=1 Tax=unclassified Streptomyces TaxID=2593676 RepID=UPI002DDC45D1|nr:glycosyltransferase 87 family protein [Streptomyces sp. NBC_01750]WSB02035.1 glycosyltransferase 87 family protein [Streptomyces sp. NBC_01794]WSD33697.1 glycosyltransferase 87 family protein [Streptomyces sp. NBC_01750]